MPTLDDALRESGLPLTDARALAAAVLRLTRAQLVTRGPDPLEPNALVALKVLFARRQAGEPVAYLTGEREFYGLPFHVSPAVLIPRPETELLVDFALEIIGATDAARVLDLGTGSGCIAIAIAHHRPQAQVTAVDRSGDALVVARANAQALVAKVQFVQGDWFAALEDAARYNLIVANPPYVAAGDPHLVQGDLRYEPATALASGADGLDAIRAIVAAAPAHLDADGWLALEHGYEQAAACRELLAQAGFEKLFSRPDLAGIERVSGGRLS
jgi:release factor glutamine methyltransferase